ncbi:MAG: Holliday junction resolvase RuvX [Acidobacteriaceae bacterium]
MTDEKNDYTRQMDVVREMNATELEPAETQTGVVRRIMAFDVGDRRIGVAVSDPLGYTAQPLLTLHRTNHRADMKSIARLLRKHAVAEAVVGNPLNMSSEVGPRARKAKEFAEQVHAEFGIAVHLIDERLTTWEAHQLLDEAGHSRRGASARQQRKQIIDQVAAVLILKSFLEHRADRTVRNSVQTLE